GRRDGEDTSSCGGHFTTETCLRRTPYWAGVAGASAAGAAGAAGASLGFFFSIRRLSFLTRLLSDLVFLRSEWMWGSFCGFLTVFWRSPRILPMISFCRLRCLWRSSRERGVTRT